MAAFLTTLTITFLLETLAAAVNDGYCSSSTWTPCSADGKICEIPPNINQTTISYGGYKPNSEDGQWVFIQVTNTRDSVFKMDCSKTSFGEVYPSAPSGTVLGCCFVADSSNSLVNFEGPSMKESDWKLLTNQSEQFNADPIQHVRFGHSDALGGVYIYRWMQGSYKCDAQWFGQVTWPDGWTPTCSAIPSNNMTYTDFVPCGNSQVQNCNMDVATAGGEGVSIALVQYGNYPNFVHRYAYSTNNNDQIPCTSLLFGDPNPDSQDEAFCAVSNYTGMTGAVGRWVLATSCAGSQCIINEMIKQGTTSTSSKSTTKSWQTSVSNTVSAGFDFMGFNAGWSIDVTTSASVSNTVKDSYSQSVEKDCGVTCGDGSADTWTVFQWLFEMGEYQGTDLSPFSIYACYYVCSTHSTYPQCPPGYCKPGTDCTQCAGWSPPSPPETSAPKLLKWN